MSTEKTAAVKLPVDTETEDLLRDIDAAFRRGQKSEPGERTDIVAFETLRAALELRAAADLRAGRGQRVDIPAQDNLRSGLYELSGRDVVVVLTLALSAGTRTRTEDVASAPPPAAMVELRDDVRGRRLVLRRFREQLEKAVTQPGADRGTALNPSGIHNRVLTEVLREYVAPHAGGAVSVPVVYRDGSRATSDFPLRCVELAESLPSDDVAIAGGTLVLRLALLSIRHSEMDVVVDGAWLRNADVSKPRPAAQTDDYAYHQSVRQLAELTDDGRRTVRIYMFQTGLETAVVGFLRAVVEFLRKDPGRLEVIPMFFTKNSTTQDTASAAGYEPGDPWAANSERRWAQ